MDTSAVAYPCPKCERRTALVVKTRDVGDHRERRRECSNCGLKFKTQERFTALVRPCRRKPKEPMTAA